MKSKLWGLFPLIFLMLGCTVAPKGEYPRAKISRPYALPDDVGRTYFGALTQTEALIDPEDSATGEAESENQVFPALAIEHGISDSVSWSYPVGLKWGIYEGRRHTFGLSAETLLFFNSYSLDYWYRISPRYSIRPYIRGRSVNYLFVAESFGYSGLELVYQATDRTAVGLFGHSGSFTSSSELIEAIVTGYTGDDDYDTEVQGTMYAFGANFHHSFSDRWDFKATGLYQQRSTDEFAIRGASLQFGFGYFW